MTASMIEVFGNGSASFICEGDIFCQPGAAINPASTAGDYVLAVYTLPANSLDQAGRGLAISAAGSFAATANNKRVKIIIGANTAVVGSTISGGTTIADSGTVATNNAGWQLSAALYKYGATGSNTQVAIHNAAQMGSATAALIAPSLQTLNESSPILIAVTGNATTAATDISLNLLEINATN